MTPIDPAWLAEHPLPIPGHATDKNERGRILVVGGSTFVPGALRLTGEAALRAGAGKLQLATVGEVAVLLGLFVPEGGVVALPSDPTGELDPTGADTIAEHAKSCDALVLGPGMGGSAECAELIGRVFGALAGEGAILLDAGAIPASRACADIIRSHAGPVVITPHHGEMAALTGRDIDDIHRKPYEVARAVAVELGALVVLKDAETIVAAPSGECLRFDGGTPGLATGGSGDVLAGIVGGLLARRIDPLIAAAWAVWAHGRAGQVLTDQMRGTGLIARDLLDLIPQILNAEPD